MVLFGPSFSLVGRRQTGQLVLDNKRTIKKIFWKVLEKNTTADVTSEHITIPRL